MVKFFAVISPAKTLDFESESPIDISSRYRCVDQSSALISQLRSLSVTEIQTLMHLSEPLAQLNVARYQAWQGKMTQANSKQALFAFKGDVYTGLNAQTLTVPQIETAQQRVRIISGLYGLLRPLDKIQPYRLEMGTRLKTEQGANLYTFWGNRITELLNLDMKAADAKVLVNLASLEYSKAINSKLVTVPMITPVFKDEKNGDYKVISFFAKKARGMMVRYLLEGQITDLDGIKAFDYGGYHYSAADSDQRVWTFKRSMPINPNQ
ncbi:peroxide stress protein YaaA [Reinekea sp.]|jgi:cytoplasmic iron level regulating protein YaaA (DUF328/UPF0246 family)|uniref:peroxide stress protein YaaA n=1 Tax=Reinekea sp. TaxID=1970455 RepID=UPI002A8278C2|nr:peroxide stress protein YaaA [Reinekea sp.]